MVVADGTLGEQRSGFLDDVILDIHVSVHIEQVFVVQAFTAAFVFVYGGRDVVEVPVVCAYNVPDSLDKVSVRVEGLAVVSDRRFKRRFVERDMLHSDVGLWVEYNRLQNAPTFNGSGIQGKGGTADGAAFDINEFARERVPTQFHVARQVGNDGLDGVLGIAQGAA